MVHGLLISAWSSLIWHFRDSSREHTLQMEMNLLPCPADGSCTRQLPQSRAKGSSWVEAGTMASIWLEASVVLWGGEVQFQLEWESMGYSVSPYHCTGDSLCCYSVLKSPRAHCLALHTLPACPCMQTPMLTCMPGTVAHLFACSVHVSLVAQLSSAGWAK